MKKILSNYFKQIITGIIVGVFLFAISAMLRGFNDDLSKKASKDYVDKGLMQQEVNIELIQKDIQYIKENLERVEEQNNETLQRMENKIDHICNQIKH